MCEPNKFSLKYLLITVFTVSLIFAQPWKTNANKNLRFSATRDLTFYSDTIPTSTKDSLLKKNKKTAVDTTTLVPFEKLNNFQSLRDTIKNVPKMDSFSFRISKDSLSAPVYYEATDSAVVFVKDNKVVLFGNTKTKYNDVDLSAPEMSLDQKSQILTAVNRKDSNDVVLERVHFRQGEDAFQTDTIWYNFKTQKGVTKNTFTAQNELFIQAEQFKKVNNEITFASNGVLTTCNLDEPHFGFRYQKIKVVNNKVAVTGPIHPEFEKVPIPIYLPFGFFPMKKGRHSGVLSPQFTANDEMGLGLEGLGYYKVLSDNFDITLRSNIYSYGGWSANITPSYRKRYRYSGQMNLSIQNTKYNFKGDPDYVKNLGYMLTWSHSVDSRARPGTNFSATVNAGSTLYNSYVPNNPNRNFQNKMGSSITYSKAWAGKPFNLTVSANHNQDNALHLVTLNLPDVGFTVSTLYPFQRKELAGTPKWYEKLGVAYNGTIRSQVAFYDTAFRLKQLMDTLQWGGQHNFPITLSLPPIFGGRLILSPGISYEQKLIAQKVRRSWNSTKQKLDTITSKGLFVDQKISTSFGISTALFGMFQFKNSSVTALRHVMRPSLSMSYSPSFSKKHFYKTQVDTSGRILPFSEFETSMYGYYGEQDFGGMGFTFDNNLEMKVRSKKDTGENAIKKVRLLDGFGFNTGYNFLNKTRKLSPFNFYLFTTLFEKININASTVLDPYQVDSKGFSIDKYAWEGGKFKVGRFSNGSISMSTDFKSKPKDEKKDQEKKQQEKNFLNDPILGSEVQSQLDYMRRNPSEFVDFNIPWSVSLKFSVVFNERMKPDYSEFIKDFSSNMSFNGSFSLTPKWNFSMNGYYDFNLKAIQTFQMSISREMHCWQMSINVTPIGPYRYFNISINPKSGLLQDLKINRTRFFSN